MKWKVAHLLNNLYCWSKDQLSIWMGKNDRQNGRYGIHKSLSSETRPRDPLLDIFLKDFIYLVNRGYMNRGRRRGRESQADTTLSMDHNPRLDLTTLRS